MKPTDKESRSAKPKTWTAWQSVLAFGLVSLSVDMVYEGMRAMVGPYLGTLGASALTVGLVTGAGESIALMFRLVTGVWADRNSNYWSMTVIGYLITVISVPMLALAPFVGSFGLTLAIMLILIERTGKAIRGPAKAALLARVAEPIGRGKGFGVHKALDQVGSFSGPLLLAGLAAITGVLWIGFAFLAIPGVLGLLVLAILKRRSPILNEVHQPEMELTENTNTWSGFGKAAIGGDLPRTFHLFAVACAFAMAGLMTFGVISYRFVADGILTIAAVPLPYALAMAMAALAALWTGKYFDQVGGRILLVVPFLVAIAPFGVFSNTLALVLAGIVVWGGAYGVLDSTVKAFVANLVPAPRRATAFGIFAGIQGLGALVGGGLAGALIENHTVALIMVIAIFQVVSFGLLWKVTRPNQNLIVDWKGLE